MAHRADGLNDIFEHNVIVRENLTINGGTIALTPITEKDIVNKKYVDDSFPVTHASTTGQTTDDHHPQSHNIASHSDTSATGTELNTLTDNSIADALHRHSELVASDGTPDPALSVDAAGQVVLPGRNPVIRCNTTDGADNATFQIGGGGAIGNTRGAYVNMFGNEAGGTGKFQFVAGNVAGGDIDFLTGATRLRAKILYGGATHIQLGGGSAGGATLSHGTSDGTDNGVLQIAGGGAAGTNRGAYFNIYGNEYATHGGAVQYLAGNVADGDHLFYTHNIERMRIDYGGNVGINVTDPHSKLEVNGAISSTTKTITASADNTDVSGVNTMFIDTSAGDVVVGGFTGGVAGQFLYIALTDWTNNVTLEHVEGVGTQDIIMHQATDETLTAEPGGWTLICDGSDWYDVSHAKHV